VIKVLWKADNGQNPALKFRVKQDKQLKPAAMRAKQLHTALRMKNEIILQQYRRIKILEDRLSEMRHRYFELKYPGTTLEHPQHLMH
jgi:hypothetical protein